MTTMRHQLKAKKVDLLRFIAKRQILTSFDVAHAFGYSSHKSAVGALSRLGKKGLIQSEVSPDGRTKNWWLTPLGESRLLYFLNKEEEDESESRER